ncbi:MAG: hypothetical protein IKU43_00420 [Clostridia bacterium]|nr:hypothetical protein [Clostridia bacterium]
MESKDFVIEQILSIENFECVPEKLMAEINSNEEYRRIFEEYKELSSLVSESAPIPEKDGVTLHDAVMNRIKDGDIAPRYISAGGFRFPVATVASLAVIVVAALIIGKGGIPGGRLDADNFAPMEKAEMRSVNDEEFAYVENTSFSVFGGALSKQSDDGVGIAVISEEAPAETEAAFDGEEITEGVVNYSVVTDSVSEEKITFKSSGMKKAEAEASPAFEESASEECEEEAESASIESQIELKMAYASALVPEQGLITKEQILELGAERYIEWFDGIMARADFVDAYSYEAFKAYCESK